jgi:excisionase family DNA binding protein
MYYRAGWRIRVQKFGSLPPVRNPAKKSIINSSTFTFAVRTTLREDARMADQYAGLESGAALPPGGAGIGESVFRAHILGDDVLLTVKEVAFLVGVSTRQIYCMIHRGTFPAPRKLGALSRWRLGTIRRWLHDDGIRRA